MRTCLIYISISILVASGISCRKDFEYSVSMGNLEFSKDTVFLDTVFSNIGSSTYTLKVFNRSKEDISIPIIGLAEGEQSGYRLNVGGGAGKVFTDVPIMAKDSLFIFIETTFDVSEREMNEYLYTDVLQFDKGDNLQKIPLITLIRDAVFLFPSNTSYGVKENIILGLDTNGEEIRAKGFELSEDQLTFTNAKPYVIYGYAVVPEKKTLRIDAGVRVHFHKDSGILVRPESILQINGELSSDSLALEKEVIFEGDRLEPEFENVPGQWGGIWIAHGSTGNTIDHLTVKNATIGLRVEGDGVLQTPTMTIKNTQIYNSSRFNLWGISAFIKGENLVLGSAGANSLYCNLGGDYSFVHTTIANYWTDSFRNGAALTIDNKKIDLSGIEYNYNLTRANFQNCIIDGNGEVELILNSNGSNTFNYYFSNCLIRFDKKNEEPNDDSLYDFDDLDKYLDNLINEKVKFKDAIKGDFRLTPSSPAIDNADVETALSVPLDILGIDRTKLPEIGAYEFKIEN